MMAAAAFEGVCRSGCGDDLVELPLLRSIFATAAVDYFAPWRESHCSHNYSPAMTTLAPQITTTKPTSATANQNFKTFGARALAIPKPATAKTIKPTKFAIRPTPLRSSIPW
jgi:hypothetical protein